MGRLNTRALQLIDRWIGIPVCGAFTLVRRLTGDGRAALRSKPQKILFVKFAEQGSTVLAYPAILRASEMVGRTNLYFIVFEENRFILDVMGALPPENVITIRHDSLVDLALQAWRALWRIWRLQIDAAVDLEFFSRSSAALTFLTGARSRVGLHTFFGEGPYRGDLMTHRLLYNPYLHTSQMFQLMIEALERAPERLPTHDAPAPRIETRLPEFVPSPSELEGVREILRRASGVAPAEDLHLILLNANASDLLPLRRWPAKRYIDLARLLLKRFPEIHIALTGAPDEAKEIEQIAREIDSSRCFSLARKTTLRQLLVLYTLSELLITNDSGPAHFASMTPVTVITLFGPETPLLFAARTPRNIPLWMGLACSPCVNAYNNRQSPCQDNVCMQQITTQRVFEEACKAYLARRGAVAEGVKR
ncbi:MAG: glycosyltransferase family 9 protein [Chthoniobacterales bacterium]